MTAVFVAISEFLRYAHELSESDDEELVCDDVGEEIVDSSDLELLFKDATVLGDVE
jgi:hypothetical protein